MDSKEGRGKPPDADSDGESIADASGSSTPEAISAAHRVQAGRKAPPWLLRHRIAVPDRTGGYLHRRDLEERCAPFRQRVTLMMAPGGFGKTTLLAECCRAAIDRGIPTAWVSMDERDEPDLLETYLVFAFEFAGLEVLDLLRVGKSDLGLPYTRADLLARAIEAHGQPCVLALDELERVKNPESVALLNSLVRRGPPGLHLAISCRELPAGLDVAPSVLGGDAEILTADDLRFSKPEIARFFDLKLSRQELAEVAADSAGWPIALRIRRNERAPGPIGELRAVRHVIENWVESRLWTNFSDKDREFLLDVGLFDWFDASLLQDVLQDPHAMDRLDAMTGLTGLMLPLPSGGAGVQCLHPLVRDHCARWRQRETPERFQSVQRRIAAALARRGNTLEAVRYAARAADTALVRRILADAGGVRLMLRHGAERLLAVDAYLNEETVAANPRLGFARIVALIYRGRLVDARRAYEAAARSLAKETVGGDLDLRIDQCFARAMLAYFGCESIVAVEAVIDVAARLAVGEEPSVDPAMRAVLAFGMCYRQNLKAEFDAAEIHGRDVRDRIGRHAPYLTMVMGFLTGEAAMAQGRVADAAADYGRSLRSAKEGFLRDPRIVVWGSVLQRELNLERNRFADGAEAVRVVKELCRTGAQFSVFVAAAETAADLALEAQGADSALSVVEEMLEHARGAELPALARHLTALRVSVLAASAPVEEANRTWRTRGLPKTDRGCLDLTGQGWREMEAMSCARMRLDIAGGRFDAGRRLGRSLIELAASRGLRRTQMRALALLTSLEELTGDRDAALGHLTGFLVLFAETDYARPLVREREITAPVLHAFRDANPDSILASCAETILAASRTATVAPKLSPREMDVLQRLETQRDKEIAASLGISPHGVRYHVGNILNKLNARDRFDAARRARAAKLLSPEA